MSKTKRRNGDQLILSQGRADKFISEVSIIMPNHQEPNKIMLHNTINKW